MLNWIKSLFASKPKLKPPPDYKIHSLQMEDLRELSFTVEEMLDAKEAGFVIENFLSPEELQLAISGLRKVPEEQLTVIHEGMKTYPTNFSKAASSISSKTVSLKDYHESAIRYRETFTEDFGVDLEKRMQGVISQLWPSLTVDVAPDPDGNGSFIPYTFREMTSGNGFLISHCGKLFYKDHSEFYDRFQSFTRNDHQISYFVVIQAAEEGGELTLYDLLWKDVQYRPHAGLVVDLKGNELHLEDPYQVHQNKLDLKPGSLLVFNGGDIWHRVENVKGRQSRITLGGFLSLSHNHDKIYLWA